MKKLFALFTALFLLCACGTLCVAAAELPLAVSGDVNGDGRLNNKDLGLLQQYLNNWDVEIVPELADVTWDGKVNNKDLGMLQQYLNGELPESPGSNYNDAAFSPDSWYLNA